MSSISENIVVQRATRNSLRSFEWERLSQGEVAFTVIMLFYTSGAVLPLVLGGDSPMDPAEIRPGDFLIKAVLYAVTFLLISFQWRSFVRSAWSIKWILAPVLLALVSATWSQFPVFTIRGFGVLFATTVFGIYFGIRYSVAQQLRLLAWTFLIVVLGSYVFAIFFPAYGIAQDVHDGDWQGVFAQKNILSEAMVLAIFVFLFWRPTSHFWVRRLGIVASIVLLVLSGSATGVVVCISLLAVLVMCKLTHASFTLVISAGIALSALLSGLLLLSKGATVEALHLLHRSEDLTGRTELWNAVLQSISKRPWLGYGFSAFWEGYKGESESVLDTIGWTAWYAHNGYLDVLVQMGILGLVVWGTGYLVLCRRAVKYLLRSTNSAPRWLCIYLAFMLLYNLTEGSILTQNSIYWVLYISTAVNLSREARAGIIVYPYARVFRSHPEDHCL